MVRKCKPTTSGDDLNNKDQGHTWSRHENQSTTPDMIL